jgi:xylulose-5-phosphate/fructose-6-phosphate phosphoketolase
VAGGPNGHRADRSTHRGPTATLRPEDIKPRLGHGGSSPGLSFVHVHLDRLISPHVAQNVEGLRRLFRQFATPGGISSHTGVTTSGSINGALKEGLVAQAHVEKAHA